MDLGYLTPGRIDRFPMKGKPWHPGTCSCGIPNVMNNLAGTAGQWRAVLTKACLRQERGEEIGEEGKKGGRRTLSQLVQRRPGAQPGGPWLQHRLLHRQPRPTWQSRPPASPQAVARGRGGGRQCGWLRDGGSARDPRGDGREEGERLDGGPQRLPDEGAAF
jgi:hypothetical protein